jgi:hypothetical protein
MALVVFMCFTKIVSFLSLYHTLYTFSRCVEKKKGSRTDPFSLFPHRDDHAEFARLRAFSAGDALLCRDHGAAAVKGDGIRGANLGAHFASKASDGANGLRCRRLIGIRAKYFRMGAGEGEGDDLFGASSDALSTSNALVLIDD